IPAARPAGTAARPRRGAASWPLDLPLPGGDHPGRGDRRRGQRSRQPAAAQGGSMRFENRVALVTGAARGIGAATARLFAAEGARVAVLDLDESEARLVSDGFGDRGLAIGCDVSKRAEVDAAVAGTVERFGSLDILVCCAGILRDNLLHRMSEEDWDAVIDTHLKGTFLCVQAAQRVMVE